MIRSLLILSLTILLYRLLGAVLGQPEYTHQIDCEALTAAQVCDAACQQCQQKALRELYTALDGTTWRHSEGWTPLEDVSGSAREHCSWYGVLCCGSDGTLWDLPYPGFTQYVLTNETECAMPGGVSALLLANNGMTGELDGSHLGSSALRLSLEVLVLNGQSRCIPSSISICSRCFVASSCL